MAGSNSKRPSPRAGVKPQEGASTRTQRDKPKGDAAAEKPNSRLRVKDPLRYKTALCENWASKGSCPYSHKCQFAHGDHELRSKQAGEKRAARSTSKPMSPVSGPASPPTNAAERKRLAQLRSREPFGPPASCDPSLCTPVRPLSPLVLPNSWNPTWGPRDGDFLHDLRGGGGSPSGSYDSTLTAPLTPRVPFAISSCFGSPDLLACCSPCFPPIASPRLGELGGSLGSPPMSPGAESVTSSLLLSPLLTSALPPAGKWAPQDQPLVCNPVTGHVELSPNPPSVRMREASHNTLSVRRSISLLWNEDERGDMTEGEREAELADKMAGKGWGLAPAGPHLSFKFPAHEGLSTRSSSYSSAIEDEAGDEDALRPPGLSLARLVPPAGTYAPACAPPPPPGLAGAWLKGQPDRQQPPRSHHGVENVQRVFDYVFRDLNTIRAN
jgi:hypothetical protein